MTTAEFSDAFDTLLNSYSAKGLTGEEASSQTVVLDEYEKSLYLTKAQEEVVLSLYTGKNSNGESFESTEEMRRNLSSLIAEKTLRPIANTQGIPIGMGTHSLFFTLPEDLWFLTYESVIVRKGKCDCKSSMQVYPTKQDEYQSIKDNPFRGANERRALRLDLSEGNVEIICRYLVSEYYIRYIKKLTPIILTTLPDDLSINGEKTETGCKLADSLHQKILEVAVAMALRSKGIGINKESENN